MDDFISREAALKIPCKHCDYPDGKDLCPYKFTGCSVCYDLFELPAADVRPVVHGKWIDVDAETYTWKIRCAECGHERSMLSTQGKYPHYCENCGAQMDGE